MPPMARLSENLTKAGAFVHSSVLPSLDDAVKCIASSIHQRTEHTFVCATVRVRARRLPMKLTMSISNRLY
jgi:hypothetical protein